MPTLVFRGVRGSRVSTDPATLGHGANTTCLEIVLTENLGILLDCGSGLSSVECAPKGTPVEYHVFLTHYHIDHILGLPFFRPLFDPAASFTFYGAPTPQGDVRHALEGFMQPPWFPVPLSASASRRSFVDLDDRPVEIDGIRVIPRHLKSDHGTTLYRIESARRSVVLATDVEPGNADDDATLRSLASGADVLIHDAQYTPLEYDAHVGWGHSTWRNAVDLARDAGVGRLVLFHHAPWHTDDEIAQIVAAARRQFPETEAAREGMSIPL